MFTEEAEMAGQGPPDPFVPSFYRVAGVRRELVDTVTLDLVPQTGDRPDFRPGQFNMLYVFGVGEIAISISGDASDRTRLVHTVRDVGAVSGALARLDVGSAIGVRGPFGTGWPVTAAAGCDVVFVAGGLGLAPLRPAIHHVLAERDRYGRISILVGSRHPDDLLYRRELEDWRRRLDVDVAVTVDHADAGWHGNVGVVPSLIPKAAFEPSETIAFVCGPEVMMRFTAAALGEAGVPADRIFLSMERNMKCGIGLCGHCQFGPSFVCRDGPVMPFDAIAAILAIREI